MATTTAADRKNELIISSLISTTSVRAAAKVCGVSETQIYARLRDPAFKKQYDDARREMLEQSTAYVQGIVGEALQKMYEIMNDENVAPQIQLNAAEAIVRNCIKLTEQSDIVGQIAELMAAVFNEQ